MYDALHDTVGMENYRDIVYHSQIQDWRRALATPNNTTQYVNLFWDLREGPMVIELPPSADEISLYGTLMDSCHRPIEDYGERGVDRGRGGRYLMVPRKRWGSILPPTFDSHHFDFQYPSHLDYNRRGSLYYAIVSSIKHYGPGSFYLDVAQDEDGKWLHGSTTYKLVVPADVPVKLFWALTAYDIKTAAFIREMPSAGVSSIDEGLRVNDDGSTDLYIGPKPPEGWEVNWIPTAEGQPFYMLFRFYGVDNAVFTKTWQLNDLEVLDSEA